jgi:hypothetical protein
MEGDTSSGSRDILLLYHLRRQVPTAIASFKNQSKMQISVSAKERERKTGGLVCVHIASFPRAPLDSYAFSCESTLPSRSFLSSWW